MTRDRLGKGLGALLGEYLEPEVEASELRTLPLTSIVPNPLQPRRVFTESELADLASSIRENGLLQPLVVRPSPGSPDRFELVAGERRFRALTKLEWEEAPVVIRDADDETLLVLALVENLQREALNPIEEAEGYQALSERFGLNHADDGLAAVAEPPFLGDAVQPVGQDVNDAGPHALLGRAPHARSHRRRSPVSQ